MTTQTSETGRPSKPDAMADSASKPGFTVDSTIWADTPEEDLAVTDIEGSVPEGLRGALLRNGPGRREMCTSFWDGDGMVRRLRFDADGVRYRSRFIQTPKHKLEKNATRPMVRTAGTQLPGGPLANMFRMPADEANTHVVHHAGHLLALHEGGLPYGLDVETLETKGRATFDGALRPRQAYSAHPHKDPTTGDLYNFGITMGA